MFVKQKGMRTLVANVAIPLALLLEMIATTVQAAPRGQQSARASSLGLTLITVHERLMVVKVTALQGPNGLRAGDQIVAVNRRRVATQAAFMNRLTMTNGGTPTTSISVARNGKVQIMNVPGAGWINPALMVRTSQGVMHKDAAARLGLAGTPFP
jgi:predicted metalloprotease with PDZ domain